MKKIKNRNNLIHFAIGFSLFFAVLLRLYNLNYESLWFDEIVSFWVSEPFISFSDSYARNSGAEGTPFLFNFLLKNLHEIFGYHTHLGRYFSALISILGIFSITYLSWTLKKNNSYILVLFLVSFNVFLIKYAQEARVYSLVFFLSAMTMIFLVKSFYSNQSQNTLLINSFFYIFFQMLSIMAHPFTLIIFFSLITYYFLYFLKNKKNLVFLNFSILIIFLLLLIYLPIYFSDRVQHPASWVGNPELKFYTNFYFSSFFGSRILGLIHLLLLIILLFYYKNKFIKNLNLITFFIILILLTYFIPIIYGHLFKPVLFSRYIIFVLIPIIVLLSYLIFEIKDNKIKRNLIFFLVLITFANQFTEYNFKQFYEVRPKFKTDFLSPLEKINQSNYKNYYINREKDDEVFLKSVNNYFYTYSKENKFNVNQIELRDLKNFKSQNVWIICPQDLGNKKCDEIKNKENFTFNVLKNIDYNSVNLKLITIK